MKQLELNSYSFKVLWFLRDKNLISITMITNACNITRPTAIVAFKDLQARDYIKATKEGTIYHLQVRKLLSWT